MRSVVALLAAVLAAALIGCGDDGAEPGAPDGAAGGRATTLVLDFQPNAVHTGLYAALGTGRFADEGIDLAIEEPSSTADGAKLLEAGRADAAILDINDFGLVRERGLPLVAVAAIVQRPLAAVIAGEEIASPADLDGRTVGVTGVPSDDAVLDTVLASAGLEPDSVTRRTIGFQSVALLAAGRIDAATAFWNAEGVALRQEGIPTREFRVDELGAPRYPELVLVLPGRTIRPGPERERACALVRALERGYADLSADPDAALDHLLDEASELDNDEQRAQLAALVGDRAFSRSGAQTASSRLQPEAGPLWLRWATGAGIVESGASGEIEAGFVPLTESCRGEEASG